MAQAEDPKQEALKLLRGGPEGIKQWNMRLAAGGFITDLSEVDLSNADLVGVIFRGVDLRGTNFSNAKLAKTNFSETELSGANLSEADLRGADLRKADLRNANLRNAGMWGTLIDGADIRGANLEGIKFDQDDKAVAKVLLPKTSGKPDAQQKSPNKISEKKRSKKPDDTENDPVDSSKTTPDPEPNPKPKPVEQAAQGQISAHGHSDKWTLNDELGYELYANAIAEFLTHRSTHPPLTVGVLAPWGHGKTTLMRLIAWRLFLKAQSSTTNDETKDQEKLKQEFINVHLSTPIHRPTMSYGKFAKSISDLLAWLKLAKDQPQHADRQAKADDSPLKFTKLAYPTVWFNAWKYQDSNQVWAGLAHCILEQLSQQLKEQDRERFWLQLQISRVDTWAIRRDIYRLAFEQWLPKAVWWLGVALVGGLALVLGSIMSDGSRWAMIPGGGAAVAGLLTGFGHWVWTLRKIKSSPLEGKFSKYVQQPEYDRKLGFLHDVEKDMRHVFELIVEPDKPAVVFIDDLDRCNPGTVVQVIEALNLFLSADLPNCYFVLGMDAQVVAASIEVAHEKLSEKLKQMAQRYGSLGWFFMAKIIQLQFVIPGLSPDLKNQFMNHLFNSSREAETENTQTEAALDIAEKNVKSTLKDTRASQAQLESLSTNMDKLRKHRPKLWKQTVRQAIEVGASSFTDSDPDIRQQLAAVAPYLDSSPRSIKRFANLFRFYRLIQWSRQLQGQKTADSAALARWAVVMIRWPQLVRWILWGTQLGIDMGVTPQEKAQKIESIAKECTDYTAWLEKLKTKKVDQIDWLISQEIYQFLHHQGDPNTLLVKALETGVW